MKKLAWLFIILFLSTSTGFAEEASNSTTKNQQSSSLYQSIKSGWNSFLDVLTGKESSATESEKKETTTANTTTTKSATIEVNTKDNQNNSHGSLYQRFKDDWNRFLDFLAGKTN